MLETLTILNFGFKMAKVEVGVCFSQLGLGTLYALDHFQLNSFKANCRIFVLRGEQRAVIFPTPFIFSIALSLTAL